MKKFIGIFMVASLMAACGGGGEQAGKDKGGGSMAAGGKMDHEAKTKCSPGAESLKITARNSQFDRDCLAAKAGQGFQMEMDNQDDLQHNVAIHDSKGGKTLFKGEIVGKKKITYDVPALEAGTYHFHCEVHPTMEGTFVAQ